MHPCYQPTQSAEANWLCDCIRPWIGTSGWLGHFGWDRLYIVGQHENSGVEPELKISQGIVRAFLREVLRNPENSLRHIQLSSTWRGWHGFALIQFMGRNSRSCGSCSLVISVGKCVGGTCKTCSNRCATASCRAFICDKCSGVGRLCKPCEENYIRVVIREGGCSRDVALVALQEFGWNLASAIELVE